MIGWEPVDYAKTEHIIKHLNFLIYFKYYIY